MQKKEIDRLQEALLPKEKPMTDKEALSDLVDYNPGTDGFHKAFAYVRDRLKERLVPVFATPAEKQEDKSPLDHIYVETAEILVALDTHNNLHRSAVDMIRKLRAALLSAQSDSQYWEANYKGTWPEKDK